MIVSMKWFNLDSAVNVLGLEDKESLITLILQGDIRAGVIARAWWGFWVLPEWFDDKSSFGPVNTRREGDRTIRTFIWQTPGKDDLFLEEFCACQYWHMQYQELYELLVISPIREVEVKQLDPLESSHQELLEEGGIVSEEGFFSINNDELNRRITIDDLVIHADEIEHFTKKNTESSPETKQELNHDQALQAATEIKGEAGKIRNSEQARAKAATRHKPINDLKAKARKAALPLINRGKLNHSEIANEIKKNSDFKDLSRPLILGVVKEACAEQGRNDLVVGNPDYKKPI